MTAQAPHPREIGPEVAVQGREAGSKPEVGTRAEARDETRAVSTRKYKTWQNHQGKRRGARQGGGKGGGAVIRTGNPGKPADKLLWCWHPDSERTGAGGRASPEMPL